MKARPKKYRLPCYPEGAHRWITVGIGHRMREMACRECGQRRTLHFPVLAATNQTRQEG